MIKNWYIIQSNNETEIRLQGVRIFSGLTFIDCSKFELLQGEEEFQSLQDENVLNYFILKHDIETVTIKSNRIGSVDYIDFGLNLLTNSQYKELKKTIEAYRIERLSRKKYEEVRNFEMYPGFKIFNKTGTPISGLGFQKLKDFENFTSIYYALEEMRMQPASPYPNESSTNTKQKEFKDFFSLGFHIEIEKHSAHLFEKEMYFHALFEACKAYDKAVQTKSKSSKDGNGLMMEAWSLKKGCLKIGQGDTKTEQNVQEGIKFLSAGLMSAMRNPTAHEPALDWEVTKQDCIDMLGFISFLFRKLDSAEYKKS